MINETVFLGGCPVIQDDGIYYDGRRVIKLGLSGVAVTWVDWYNSHPDQQDSFDEAASALNDPSTTADQKENYIYAFGGSSDEQDALRNYVATGGRAALFAVPPKNYGPTPIAVVKPAGPIEAAPGGGGSVILHPGTYTYSDVTKAGDGFEDWVQSNANTVKRTVVQTSAAALPGGPAYYTDNLLVVYQDTIWPLSLAGLPTWLPPGTDPVKYWGKVTPPAGPEIPHLPDNAIPWAGAAFAVAVVVVGGVLVAYYVPRRAPPPRQFPSFPPT